MPVMKRNVFVNTLLVCLILSSLVLSACDGPFTLDMNFGQDGGGGGTDGGTGDISNSTLFILMIVVLFVVFALVLVSAVSR